MEDRPDDIRSAEGDELGRARNLTPARLVALGDDDRRIGAAGPEHGVRAGGCDARVDDDDVERTTLAHCLDRGPCVRVVDQRQRDSWAVADDLQAFVHANEAGERGGSSFEDVVDAALAPSTEQP